jgi:hypothetical protein
MSGKVNKRTNDREILNFTLEFDDEMKLSLNKVWS